MGPCQENFLPSIRLSVSRSHIATNRGETNADWAPTAGITVPAKGSRFDASTITWKEERCCLGD